eukprot:1137284-Rhodomonas_salina.1
MEFSAIVHQQVKLSFRSPAYAPISPTSSSSIPGTSAPISQSSSIPGSRQMPPGFLTRQSQLQHEAYLSPVALAAGFLLAKSANKSVHDQMAADWAHHHVHQLLHPVLSRWFFLAFALAANTAVHVHGESALFSSQLCLCPLCVRFPVPRALCCSD